MEEKKNLGARRKMPKEDMSSEWEKMISFITSTPTMTHRRKMTQPRRLFMSQGACKVPVRLVTEEEFAKEMSLKYSNEQLDSDEEFEKEMRLKCSKMTSESWVRYYTKYIMSTSHPDVSSDDHEVNETM